jgi:hypothetical protein
MYIQRLFCTWSDTVFVKYVIHSFVQLNLNCIQIFVLGLLSKITIIQTVLQCNCIFKVSSALILKIKRCTFLCSLVAMVVNIFFYVTVSPSTQNDILYQMLSNNTKRISSLLPIHVYAQYSHTFHNTGDIYILPLISNNKYFKVQQQ